MSNCCDEESATQNQSPKKRDWFFLICAFAVGVFYFIPLLNIPAPESVHHLGHATMDLMNKMWWGIALGAFFVGVLDHIPRDLVMASLGQDNGVKGLFRATLAGLLLDLCSHGILMVGMKLYNRGARLGQIMAFLVASPWNSLSLTFILIALIGLPWTVLFILFSGVMAVITGYIFDRLVDKGSLPKNPNTSELPKGYKVLPELKSLFGRASYSPKSLGKTFWTGLKDSKPIIKWLLLGVLLASIIRVFVPEDMFQEYMGPTALGLGMTLVFATIIEVCSEGSTPIAADIFNRAGAPGNAFAFLMTGVSTDYTEIMALRETTKSWKIALFLPLVTVPQVIFIAIVMNLFA